MTTGDGRLVTGDGRMVTDGRKMAEERGLILSLVARGWLGIKDEVRE